MQQSVFVSKSWKYKSMAEKEWIEVAAATTDTISGSEHVVEINTAPICPNMSNREFRELVMRACDAAVSLIQQRIAGVGRWDMQEQARARLFFGRADNEIRTTLVAGLPNLLKAMQELVPEKIVRWDDETGRQMTCGVRSDNGDNIAVVCKPDSKKRIIAIYSKFCTISDGDLWTASKIKALIHECTHYTDTFDSEDIVYSDTEPGLRIFAMRHPDSAIRNADSITGYIATFDMKIMK